jgi:hypothetical protein
MQRKQCSGCTVLAQCSTRQCTVEDPRNGVDLRALCEPWRHVPGAHDATFKECEAAVEDIEHARRAHLHTANTVVSAQRHQ